MQPLKILAFYNYLIEEKAITMIVEVIISVICKFIIFIIALCKIRVGRDFELIHIPIPLKLLLSLEKITLFTISRLSRCYFDLELKTAQKACFSCQGLA